MKQAAAAGMGSLAQRHWRPWSADQVSKVALLYGLGFLHMAPGQGVPLLRF